MRTRYLLCYDIRDDRRLRETAKIAEAFGHRLNYSVFVCDLSDTERVRCEAALRAAADSRNDSILLVDLGPAGEGSARRFRWLCGTGRIRESGEATIV